MNINVLIFFIAILLGSIFFLFKPLKIQQSKNVKEIAQIEMNNYTMYEFDTQKLVNLAIGKKALRYKDRDVLSHFVFNDNSNDALVSLSANYGVYKNDTIDLKGQVLYTKSDGIEFRSEHVFYDRKKAYAKSDLPYTAFMGKNWIKGRSLYYDLKKDKIRSKDIYAVYHIQKRN
ncbi:hypothetical protein MNB_SM-7-1272 [hydrothermal vent metagenome]|uniref:LPS export ABC transporter periplasmic protein LptC n=1 Tax=hydrothermal vent metagenome TaxID=652676 RepID=A0A1W1BG73_9ZZZZ